MNFDKEVIVKSRDIPILTVFTAKPILHENESERTDYLTVCVDVDTNSKIANEYQIRSVPTLILFNIGKLISRASGFLSKIQLNKWGPLLKHFML